MDKINELVEKIVKLLDKHNYSGDTAIYFDNKRLATFNDENYGIWILQSGYKGSDYTEYANNDTITMTFEGMFSIYNIINCYSSDEKFLGEFDRLLESYGYYYELGNSWNLSLYEL